MNIKKLKNYEPTNCRWATRKEQAMNTQRASKLGKEVEVPEELMESTQRSEK